MVADKLERGRVVNVVEERELLSLAPLLELRLLHGGQLIQISSQIRFVGLECRVINPAVLDVGVQKSSEATMKVVKAKRFERESEAHHCGEKNARPSCSSHILFEERANDLFPTAREIEFNRHASDQEIKRRETRASFSQPAYPVANAKTGHGGWLHVAGGVSAAAWLCLAGRSHLNAPALGWMLAAVATAWAALGLATRSATVHRSRTILLWALVFRCEAFVAAPVMEDDHYRFLWDGYQFAQTGNPYAEPPQAFFGDPRVAVAFQEILDRVNHPDVPTLYGPVCQWVFYFGYLVAPAKLWPWKLVLLASELLVLGLLWPTLSVGGRLLLAWCPLAIFETGFNAHPDALAIALLVAAWRFGQGHRSATIAGVMLGLAVAAKIFALLLAPFMLIRLRRRAWLATILTAMIFYAPFWIRGCPADFAGLRAMASEWEFNSSVYALAAAITSPQMARLICASAFGGIWVGLFVRWRKESNWTGLPPGEWAYGSFLLLSAVANPWYCLWLWPFVAARTSAVSVCALAAVSLSYITGLNVSSLTLANFEHPTWVRPVEFGIIGLAALWSFTKRKCRS